MFTLNMHLTDNCIQRLMQQLIQFSVKCFEDDVLSESFFGTSFYVMVDKFNMTANGRVVIPVEIVHSNHESEEYWYKRYHELHNILSIRKNPLVSEHKIIKPI